MSLTNLLQLVASGITLGAVYALVGLGFVTIYRASGVVNLAQGEFVMLGGMLTVYLLKGLHLPYWLAALGSLAGVSLLGLVVYQLVVAPLRQSSPLIVLMATIGVGLLLQNVALIAWGAYGANLPGLSGEVSLRFAGVAVLPQSLWILLMAAVVLAAMHLFNNRTRWGKAMTATATDPFAAGLCGIHTGSMIRLAFAVSALVGALAGLFVAPIVPLNFASGTIFGLKGFVAAVVGGWGKSTGAVVGGLALGLAETLGAGLLPAGYKDAIAFLVLLLILYYRPRGILGASLTEAE